MIIVRFLNAQKAEESGYGKTRGMVAAKQMPKTKIKQIYKNQFFRRKYVHLMVGKHV